MYGRHAILTFDYIVEIQKERLEELRTRLITLFKIKRRIWPKVN